MRGFSGTATNLVVSLLVNLIIFPFLRARPRSRPGLPLFPSSSFYPLVSYLPPHFSIAPLRFPPIDLPLCVSAQKRIEIPPPSCSGLPSLLFASLQAWALGVRTFCPLDLAALEPLDFCRDVSPLSQLSLDSQRRPCPPTRLRLSTPRRFYEVDASWPVIHSVELCRGTVG